MILRDLWMIWLNTGRVEVARFVAVRKEADFDFKYVF